MLLTGGFSTFSNGNSTATRERVFEPQRAASRSARLAYLKQVRDNGTSLPSNIVKHIEAGLWEVRPEYGGIEYRFMFFIFGGRKIGIVAAFAKKRDKIERRLIETSLREHPITA